MTETTAAGGRRVLLVEDDPAIARAIADGLPAFGFEVTCVTTGAEALAHHPDADLVLLDLGLPDMDGTDVCRELRRTSGVPLIIITARSDEIDQVVGLELGADDYLSKPFGLRTLVARIRAVLRRGRAPDPTAPEEAPASDGATTPELRSVGDLVIDPAARRTWLAGEEIALTPKEFDLLLALAEQPGVVHRREDLISGVWDAHWFGSTRTLDVHVGSLRRKLTDAVRIETVRGVGFRLEAGA